MHTSTRLRFFGTDRATDPNDYLEVLQVVDALGTDVAVTRGGGLFVRMDRPIAVDDAEAIAITLTLVLCEFAIRGLFSHPITDIDVQSGKLIGRHASITGGFGMFGDRTWGPYALLATESADVGASSGMGRNDYWPPNFYWFVVDPNVLDGLDGVPNAARLRDVSPTLPALLVAAAYHARRHSIAETILASWIVTEEILSSAWDGYVAGLGDGARRKRLKDYRIYTASVQTEALLTAGVLHVETYEVVHQVRKVRNDLAHRSVMSQQAASACLEAMRVMLRRLAIATDHFQGWTYQSGGAGAPAVELEPEFPFK